VAEAIDRLHQTVFLEEGNKAYARLRADAEKAEAFFQEARAWEAASCADTDTNDSESSEPRVRRMTGAQFLEQIDISPPKRQIHSRQYSREEIDEFVELDKLDPELSRRMDEIIKRHKGEKDSQ
jgi:hypothetical protein